MTNSIFDPLVSAMDPVTAFAKSLLLTCNIFLTVSRMSFPQVCNKNLQVTGIGLLIYGIILLVIERRYMVIDNYDFSFENWIICTAVILLVVSLFGYYVNYKEIKTYLLLVQHPLSQSLCYLIFLVRYFTLTPVRGPSKCGTLQCYSTTSRRRRQSDGASKI